MIDAANFPVGAVPLLRGWVARAEPLRRGAARWIASILLAAALSTCGGVANVLCPPSNCPDIPRGRINADH